MSNPFVRLPHARRLRARMPVWPRARAHTCPRPRLRTRAQRGEGEGGADITRDIMREPPGGYICGSGRSSYYARSFFTAVWIMRGIMRDIMRGARLLCTTLCAAIIL